MVTIRLRVRLGLLLGFGVRALVRARVSIRFQV